MSDSPYGYWDKLLHRLAIGQTFIAETSFNIDQALFGSRSPVVSGGKHVFISGLARAGTTVLMRRFYGTGVFRSLTYRDMPFVLMPQLWKKLSSGSRKHMEKEERAHGDGLMVDFDSPEAFDEVFWRVLDGDTYITDKGLIPHQPSTKLVGEFQRYIGSIIASGSDSAQSRYLSKNNNNILRLNAIKAAFPSSVVIVPFRSPLQHAYSLLRQHRRFNADTEGDTFTRDYMSWLGHYEFGATQRPFAVSKKSNPYQPEQLDYWLFQWHSVYGWLDKQAPQDVSFLSYESLCENTTLIWARLSDMADLSTDDINLEAMDLREASIDEDWDKRLESECMYLYERLRQAEATVFDL